MNRKISGAFLFFFFLCFQIGMIKEAMGENVQAPFVDHSPNSPAKEQPSSPLMGNWTIAPFVSYYAFTGGGDSRYFSSALGIGGELERTLPGKLSRWRWNIDGSYLQMTPGPTLFVTSSQSALFGQPSQTPVAGPLPGSASITGWMLRTGLARDFPEALPDGWLGHGVIVPYLRLDVGSVDLAASGSGALNGHPLGLSLDGGAGVSLRVPGAPMGVFAEITPTEILISQEALFITPLTVGITFHF